MLPALQTAYNFALDAVFPPRCAGCETWCKELFCPACQKLLQPIAPPFCHICGKPFDKLAFAADECADCRKNRYHKKAPPFKAMRSIWKFDEPARHAVHRFKYNGKTAQAAPFGQCLHEFLIHQPDNAPAIPTQLALLAPVPLHSWRQYRRGYNQSALLAQQLSCYLDVPFGEVLKRTRHTAPQVELGAADRLENVRGAFAIVPDLLQRLNPKLGPVLLLDDVCTTGSTIAECARVLKAAGIKEVYALTLARQL